MELLRIHKNRSLDNRKCQQFKAPWLTNNFSIDASRPTTADWMSGVGTVVETAPAASEGNTKQNSVGNSDGTASTTGTNSETSQTTTQTPKKTPHRVQYYADSENISGSPKTPATISTSWGSGNLSGDNGNIPTSWKSTSDKDAVIKYMKANYGSDADLKIGDKALSGFNSVQEMQQALQKQGYLGLEDDNYAGLQTMETMRDYFGGSHRQAGDTAPTQDPSKGLAPQAVIPETKVPEETTINAAERDKLNTQNYTRSQVRQKMRSAGLGAYDYSGSQRKALRNYYAGNRDADTIKSIQSMGLSSAQLGALGLNALSERVGKNGEWYSSKAMRDAFENPIEQKKQGGSLKMKVNYFQPGGVVAAQAASAKPDVSSQLAKLILTATQDEKALTQVVQLLQSGEPQVQEAIKTMTAKAQQGDEEAAQATQVLQAIMKKMQGQAQAAKRGAKLSYLHSLKTGCPDGYEVSYNKKGGHLCKECLKKHAKEDSNASEQAPKDACGSKLKKKLISGKKLSEGNKITPTKQASKNFFGGKLYLNY